MEEKKKIREIDIMAQVGKVWKEKKLLAGFVIVFAVLGVIVALSTPREYTAETILAPEMSAGGLNLSGNLADMASSFGVELGGKSSMDAIYPKIYPDVLGSTDFILSLFDVPVRVKNDSTPRSYHDHLLVDSKSPFWRLPQLWLTLLIRQLTDDGPKAGGKINPFMLSRDDEELVKAIRGSINCMVDKKTSVISISVSDQDPVTCAIMADTLQMRLQKYITAYRTHKARLDLQYYEKLYQQSRDAYHKAQLAYATFADANTDVVLQSLRAKQEELENEMQLKYNIYTQQMARMQTAKAKVQESTPAFTIIQSSTVPNRPSSTPRSLTVMVWIAIGVMMDALWVCWGRQWWNTRRRTGGNGGR